ncbi:MAG: outer membrane protein assembly factor BamE [Hydrogenophaga sp.]|uniref:outer membrane protein assembly factor BamE domain-containing protein n=1 Tax=Hydrogenophaga sp. TaxID=1904254 RepID=UPI001DFFAD3A|nr:outer membrane protein assembly factor BamE [Hydrogenophaga sp.]MBX3608400.1 outer membrane protein assembly factor BamE [Hydrogenophaga sp.]
MKLFWAAVLALALVACAGVPERVALGSSRTEVQALLGEPTGRYALVDGERWQYSRQPAGQQVFNLDFDRSGRLVRNQQVLDIRWLEQHVAVDRWTRDDVLRELGRPALIDRVWSFRGEVWNYRFLEFNNPRLAHLHIDPQGVVRKLMFTDERLLDALSDRL